jgi:hypothetical protein
MSNLSFFHVAPRLQDFCPIDFTDADTAELETIIRQGDKACIDRFFAHARKKLTDSGFHDSQIHIDFKEGGFRIGKAILEAYQQGKYGTLVIGRRGMDKKFFTGSVSRYLINQFSDGCPLGRSLMPPGHQPPLFVAVCRLIRCVGG